MKKMLCVLFILIISILFFPAVHAQADPVLQNTLEASGAGQVTLTDDASGFMEENHISISDPQGTLSITPKMVFRHMWESFKDNLTQPLKVLGGLIAVILLTAVIDGLGDTVQNKNTARIFSIISTLVCVGIITEPICTCIQNTANALVAGGNFMISYVPVFSGILAASGNITSAGSYNIIVLSVAEIFTQIASTLLMPLLGFCMALAVVESINPAISLSGMTNGIKKAATWGVGFLMTIFVGLLTIQSITGSSVDTVTIKATKFVMSSAIPVVGSAVSDAYTTLRGSLGLLRSGVGTYGVIALVLTMLPSILAVMATQLAVYLGSVGAEIFGVKAIAGFLKNVADVLAIALSLLLCFSIMLIISTTIVMMMGMNLA